MEDPESEFKIQEYYCSKDDDEPTVVKWMLTKGYSIGKKIAVTGIVISSAPLIVPPLVVFSAMGIAFSVPFGLLFAGYACTNKLMTMLLPTPPSPLMLEYYTDGGDDFRQLMVVGEIKDEVEGYDTDKEDMELMDDHMNNIVLELVDQGKTLMTNVDEDVENATDEKERSERMEDVMQGVEMRPTFDVAGDDQGCAEDDDSLAEERKGDGPLVDENRVGNTNEDAKLSGNGRRVYNTVEVIGESAANVAFGDVEDVETTKPITVKEIDSRKLVEIGSKNDEPLGVGAREVIGDANKDERNIESLEVGNEMKEVPDDENVNLVARSPLKPAPLDTDDARDAKDTSKAFKKMPFREDNIDDEKMWEKIRAMRTIVGYKEPRQPTCIGELKALYVFTGVEPPASFEDDSDLDEVNAKIKFLMAIVGVK